VDEYKRWAKTEVLVSCVMHISEPLDKLIYYKNSQTFCKNRKTFLANNKLMGVTAPNSDF
jgi:hypothetical protein